MTAKKYGFTVGQEVTAKVDLLDEKLRPNFLFRTGQNK